MNDTLALTRLDFAILSSNLRFPALALLGGCVVLLSMVGNGGTAGMGMMMAITALFASYPFAIGEKSGIDVLYTTLRLSRRSVVTGRYLFALACDLLALAVVYTLSLVTGLALRPDQFDPLGLLITGLVLFGVFSLVQAVQLPMFFKLGYTKAKFLAYTPLVALPVILLLVVTVSQSLLAETQLIGLTAWTMSHLPIVIPLLIVIWMGLMLASFRLSNRFYARREF